MRSWLSIILLAGGGACGAPDQVEVCDNRLDDDLDGFEDCADTDCLGQCPELCGDSVDNDLDGSTDCVDIDCDCVGADCVGKCGETCDDTRDNDGDGLADCADLDCDVPTCPEICGDGRDNDFDGGGDCDDSECYGPACVEDCSDHADNDADGGAECDDADCIGVIECPEICADGFDNDMDGRIDCVDPDCRSDEACPEFCDDGIDNDGDLFVDCDDATDCDFFCDADGDGFLNESLGGPDCNDNDPLVAPNKPEICDGQDNDCDDLVDQDDPSLDPSTMKELWTDADNDGYGKPGPKTTGCDDAPFLADNDDDCDDISGLTFPGNPEVCDGMDNDCVGGADDLVASPTNWYTDIDRDGFGTTFVASTCTQPAGTSDVDGDCNDSDPDVGPTTLWVPDVDSDGYGAGVAYPVASCDPPTPVGWAPVYLEEDCDDTTDTVSPEAVEACGDLVDSDCDDYPDDCFHRTVPFVGANTVAGCLFGNAGDVRWDNLGSLTWKDCMRAATERGAMTFSSDGSVVSAWGAHRERDQDAMNADFPTYAIRNITSADTCLVGREAAATVDSLPLANRTVYDGDTWAWEEFGLKYYDECIRLAAEHGGSMITPHTLGYTTVWTYWVASQDECNAYNWVNSNGTSWTTDAVTAEVERSGEHHCRIGYMEL